MKYENVLPALIMNLIVCALVVLTIDENIKYLFYFFIIFHVTAIVHIYYPRGNINE